jgi:very-short-patch-repair endonuclease
MIPPITDLQDAIAQTIADNEKAYHIEQICRYFGLDTREEYHSPSSKYGYVLGLVKCKDDRDLIALAEKVYERYRDDLLKQVLDRFQGGVSGEIKNLIFAANGDKPEIVLADAIQNTIDVVANAQYCLIYDKPLSSSGLLWQDLVSWWQEKSGCEESHAENNLYDRLKSSLQSKIEVLLFFTYYSHLKVKLGEKLPALIPQVYLHYDPKTLRELKGQRRIPRERMDFLLLLSDRERIVIEVDGKHHYAIDDTANPPKYAEMVSEDRKLRLRGYEVYRFGGYELFERERGQVIIKDFFHKLFEKHGISFE